LDPPEGNAMRSYAIESSDGNTVTYQDKKRWLWLLSLINPTVPLIGVIGHLLSGHELWLLMPVIVMFAVGPL
jgi:alkane 1-monooxygenase